MILTLFLVPLHLVTRSIRWKYLLRPVKAGLRMSNAIEANTLGFTMNFIFPGRLGEVVRPVFLARREKLSPGYLIGTIVVERTFDMFAMCFLLGSFLISRPVYGSFYQARPEALPPLLFWGKIGLALSVLLFILIILVYSLKAKANGVIYFFSRLFLKNKMEGRSLWPGIYRGLEIFSILAKIIWLFRPVFNRLAWHLLLLLDFPLSL